MSRVDWGPAVTDTSSRGSTARNQQAMDLLRKQLPLVDHGTITLHLRDGWVQKLDISPTMRLDIDNKPRNGVK